MTTINSIDTIIAYHYHCHHHQRNRHHHNHKHNDNRHRHHHYIIIIVTIIIIIITSIIIFCDNSWAPFHGRIARLTLAFINYASVMLGERFSNDLAHPNLGYDTYWWRTIPTNEIEWLQYCANDVTLIARSRIDVVHGIEILRNIKLGHTMWTTYVGHLVQATYTWNTGIYRLLKYHILIDFSSNS